MATVLADTLEAVIGAIYLDSGLDAARALVRRHWDAKMQAQVLPPKDPKTGNFSSEQEPAAGSDPRQRLTAVFKVVGE